MNSVGEVSGMMMIGNIFFFADLLATPVSLAKFLVLFLLLKWIEARSVREPNLIFSPSHKEGEKGESPFIGFTFE